MASQEKISVYNLADLKNTSDDAIPNYLNSLGFRQSHRLTDVRLGLGFSALALAAAAFAWDYKFGFDATKHLTAVAVAIYTLLNGALALWISHVERGTVYVGTSPGGEDVRISTSVDKNVPVYHVTVEITSKGGKKETLKIDRPFAEWFDEAGRFVAAPFQALFARGVPVIGKADPKRARAEEEGEKDTAAAAATAYTPEMLDVLAKATVASGVGSTSDAEATGATGVAKKGGKRRKA
ncbi:hypothetical protein VTJ83DRAFT_1958 [Remersonia thermophila]|uniref:Signal peptidase complex subunit 2 n=1 Tax=Remersonia thermophila TaxID=72144 RepID=A0ABR4DJM6_9PEZI